MYTIVGLGNPGTEYEHTRHNAGWIVLTWYQEEHGLPEPKMSRMYNAMLTEGRVEGSVVRIVFPQTYMNRSGDVVAKLLADSTEKPEGLIIVHDDIDLPLGTVRVSHDRGAGGHNGVRSIVTALKTQEFTRIRVGIAQRGIFAFMARRPVGEALSRYVLAPFSQKERTVLTEVKEKVSRALTLVLTRGTEAAMQEINGAS